MLLIGSRKCLALFERYIKPNLAYVLILLPLLADIATGLIDLTVGVGLPLGALVRFSILVLGIYFIVSRKCWLSKLIQLIICMYISLFTYWFYSQGGVSLGNNLKPLLFIILPFLVFLLLKENEVSLEQVLKAMSLYGMIAGSSIVICYFLGIGYESYGDYTFGFKGVFISGNDIGICIILSSSIAWYRAASRFSFIDITSAFTSYVSLIFIASRTGIVVGTLVLIVGIFCFLFFAKSSSKIGFIFKGIITFFASAILAGVVYLSIEYIDEIAYHSERLIELSEGVSPREQLEIAAKTVNESLSMKDLLFGQGYQYYYLIGEEHHLRVNLGYNKPFEKNVEKDFHDLFGLLGIIFTTFYALLILLFWAWVFLIALIEKSSLKLTCLIMFSFLIIHSIMAGHVILGSQVPLVAVGLVFLGLSKDTDLENKVC